jgi:hypothetical protein
MNDPTAWPAGKRFGELSPEQKIAVAKRAAAQLQDELQRNAAAISAAMDAAEAGELDEPHADYPHEPGRLYDCPACESHCYCRPGETECVFSGPHNGLAES